MRKIGIAGIFIGLLVFSSMATAPSGYYNSLEGKKAAALKTALHDIICRDTTHYLDYGSGKGSTWEGFYSTDRDPLTNAVIDMYSDSVRYFPNPNPDFTAFGQTIHIEHSVPKSWWGCDITHPDCPAKDLNHLYPADGSANTSKNDNPLGVVSGTPTFNNGVTKVGPAVYDGYVGAVFEPADRYKGDFARSYFYMATAYEHYAAKWDTSKPENMMMNNTYPVLKPWAVKLLLQWHRQDPVSQKETTRTDVVYSIQQNRNPFIDHPELVEYIWGDRTTIPYRLDGSISFPYLNWPNYNDTLKLGTVYLQQAKDTVIGLSAMNLTGDLTLTLSGVNASAFSLNKTTITKAEAEAGYNIGVHFLTTVAGTKTAVLTISGGGITPVPVNLKALSSEDFAALPAKNTNSTGFTANWTPSPGATGYSLHVFTLQNSGATTPRTLLEEDFTLALPNTWSREGYTEFLSGSMRLASTSNYGKITMPALDLSVGASILTVRAKQYGSDTGAKLTATLNNNSLAAWTTTTTNQDFTANIPQGSNNSVMALSAIAGKRVYVDYVKVEAQIPVYNAVSVASFPKAVGNLLSYAVTGLQTGNTYYYTVTPQGNGAAESNRIQVQTTTYTATKQTPFPQINLTVCAEGLQLSNLTPDSRINLFDTSGRLLKSVQCSTSVLVLPINRKGLYLLKLINAKNTETYKIRF